MAESNHLSVPSREVTQDLTRAATVLQDMQSKGMIPNSPGIPPAMFGAGGPMSACLMLRYI